MSTSIEDRCKDLIIELGLASEPEIVAVEPLTGGVSSDIALVDLGNRKVCVKFALPQLKVSEQWHANIERNKAEYLWLDFVGSIEPSASPTLFGRSAIRHGFVMEYIEGDEVYLWKNALLQSKPDRSEAQRVGDVLGRIHRASSGAGDVRENFQNQEDFFSLRIEPYLSFTASRHPDLSGQIQALIDMLNEHEPVLIHGDVSPKNIIFRQMEPVFLDAECATMGDPSFDISFCLNHLVIKAVHLPPIRGLLLESVQRFWRAYEPHVNWEDSASLEERVSRLLPALMLARIDGKSPVEYLDAGERLAIRSMAIRLIENPERSLVGFVDRLTHYLETDNNGND